MNLKSYDDMDKLIKKISYGNLDATFDLHNGSIVAVRFYGSKRLIYNRSSKDQNTNEVAVRDIISRIALALNDRAITELNFSVKTNGNEIKSVSWASQVKKRYKANKEIDEKVKVNKAK